MSDISVNIVNLEKKCISRKSTLIKLYEALLKLVTSNVFSSTQNNKSSVCK